jgi:hypothetical protein
VLNLLLTTAETKFSNNQSQLQTIYKAKARLAELKNMQYMLSGFIAESNIGLNILMVRDVNTPFEIDTLIQPRNYSVQTSDTANITNRSDITALTKYIQSMKLEQKVMKVGVRPDFGVRAEHMQMFGMPINGHYGHDDNSYCALVFQNVFIRSKIYGLSNSVNGTGKTNHGTDGNQNVHRKTNHAPLRKRTISELHQQHHSCL